MIRFRCPGCKKVLSVQNEMAGKRATCSGCKKPFVIPVPKAAPATNANPTAQSSGAKSSSASQPGKPSAHVDKLAADFLARSEAAKQAARPAPKIRMTCLYCDEALQFDRELAGKRTPCPSCRRIIQVDKPKDAKVPQNWREGTQSGPQFTKKNLEDKLDNVMSTGDKALVSAEALAEAGALPDRSEPVSHYVWVRRSVIGVAAVGVLAVTFVAAAYYSNRLSQKQSLRAAEQTYEEVKKTMPRHWDVAYRWSLGRFHARADRAAIAKKHYDATYSRFPPVSKSSLSSLAEELLLIEVALAQADLGGERQAVSDEKRIAWDVVLQDLARTLAAIYSKEGKLLGLRRVCGKLIDKGEILRAKFLAHMLNTDSQNANEALSLAAAEVAMHMAKKENRQANLALAKIMKAKAANVSPAALLAFVSSSTPSDERRVAVRLGYAEGLAHQGNFKKARQMAGQSGVAVYRLQTHLAVADIALHKGNRAEAKTSLLEALKIGVDVLQKQGIPSLLRYQIVELCTELKLPKKAEAWVDGIPDKGCQGMARLHIVQKTADVKLLEPEKVGAKNSLAYALAVQFAIRHDGARKQELLDRNKKLLYPLIHVAAALAAN